MHKEQKIQNQTIATLRGETQPFCLGLPLPDFQTAPSEDWRPPTPSISEEQSGISLRRWALSGLLRTWRRHTRGRLRRLLSTTG